MPDIGHDIDLLVGRQLGLVRSMLLHVSVQPVTLHSAIDMAGKFKHVHSRFGIGLRTLYPRRQSVKSTIPEDTIINER